MRLEVGHFAGNTGEPLGLSGAATPIVSAAPSSLHCCAIQARRSLTSTTLADAVQHVRAQGKPVPDALLAHTSPLTWEHIGAEGPSIRKGPVTS